MLFRSFNAALTLLAALATSPAFASVSLAYHSAAPILARALRAKRVAADWGVRANVLAATTCLARLDGNAAALLLEEGLFATVEAYLFVRILQLPHKCYLIV